MLLFLKFTAFVLSLMNIICDVEAYFDNEDWIKDSLPSTIFGKDMLLFILAVILFLQR